MGFLKSLFSRIPKKSEPSKSRAQVNPAAKRKSGAGAAIAARAKDTKISRKTGRTKHSQNKAASNAA
jgi:hypothetical protein